jgi:putative component of toxin-antitoxin plasmid stabilization module
MFIAKQLPEFADWLHSRKDSMTRIRLAKRLDKAQRESP